MAVVASIGSMRIAASPSEVSSAFFCQWSGLVSRPARACSRLTSGATPGVNSYGVGWYRPRCMPMTSSACPG